MARDDLAASASRVLAVVARRGRSHGDDEAARRVGGGGVEADGGEGAAAQGGFSAVEEEARGCRMRPGRIVPGGEGGGGVEVEGRRRIKVIGCSSLRGGGGELGTNKNLDLWLQLVCTKHKLKHTI